MQRVRKNDQVVVIAGKDRGTRGRVLKILRDRDRVIVEGVNRVKRHQKPTQKNAQGGIIEKEGTIHISNVALFDDKLGRGTRTKTVNDGKTKTRVGVKSGTQFPNAGME